MAKKKILKFGAGRPRLAPKTDFGLRLRAARLAKCGSKVIGEVAAALAAKNPDMRFSRSQLSRYETGDRLPPYRELVAMCQYYGVQPNWLTMGIEPAFFDATKMPKDIMKLAKNDPRET